MNTSKQILILAYCIFQTSISFAQLSFDTAFFPFLGRPYVAHTLEQGLSEPLTINTKEVDCTTFVEYVLASQIAEMPAIDDDILYDMSVEQLRYRNGERKGYLSRLHYFTEWIEQQKNGDFFIEISPSEGLVSNDRSIDFMSKNAHRYPVLKENPAFIDSLKQIEAQVNQISWSYTPIQNIDQIIPLLQKGDLIAIVTDIPGLDISHVGFAYPHNNEIHLLHASSVAKKVIIDRRSLKDYLLNSKKTRGIRVLRLQPKNK